MRKTSKAEKARIADICFDNGRAEWERDGLRFVATIRDDDDYDTSWLGEFTDTYRDGAIEHVSVEPHAYKWFVPARSHAEQVRGLVAMKYSRRAAKGLATRYVRADYERARTYGDRWQGVGIVVEAFHGDSETPCTDASMWGIESDSEKRYFRSCAADLADECAGRAKSAAA